jgi:anthranilate 1,2-dioxygenase small subunit
MTQAHTMAPTSNATLDATRIAGFLTRYAHALDDDRLEAWPDFFTQDAVYHITTRENDERGYPIGIIHCEGMGMLHDRIRALRTANIFEKHTYCHILGQPEITAAEDGWRVRSNFTLYRTMYDGRTDLFATGKYMDIVTETDGRLLLRERRVIVDSRRIDTLLVIPL